MFIITQALGMPRDVERRESGYIFLDKPFLQVRMNRVKSVITALKGAITKQ